MLFSVRNVVVDKKEQRLNMIRKLGTEKISNILSKVYVMGDMCVQGSSVWGLMGCGVRFGVRC